MSNTSKTKKLHEKHRKNVMVFILNKDKFTFFLLTISVLVF